MHVMKEPITSITDFILSLEGLFFAYFILSHGTLQHKKSWGFFFIFLSIGALLGGLYHGFEYFHKSYIWFCVTGFVLAAMSFFPQAISSLKSSESLWPSMVTKILLMISILILFLTTWTKSFEIPFYWVLAFEGVIITLSLILVFQIFLGGYTSTALYLVGGFSFSIIAALFQIQLFGRRFWILNHNDLFHIVQMLGLLCFFIAWKTSMLERSLI